MRLRSRLQPLPTHRGPTCQTFLQRRSGLQRRPMLQELLLVHVRAMMAGLRMRLSMTTLSAARVLTLLLSMQHPQP